MKTSIKCLFVCVLLGTFLMSCEEELNYHHVAIESTEGGYIRVIYDDPKSSVDISSYQSLTIDIAEGYTATAYAYPDEYGNYVFMGWYEAAKLVSTESHYDFGAYNDFSLTAKFTKQSLIVLSRSEGGKVAFKETSDTLMRALPGDSVTVIATPDDGYGFVGWYTKTDDEEFLADGSDDSPSETIVSADNIYTFEVSEDVELFARFAKKVVVTLDVLGNGEARFEDSSEKSLEFFPGDSVTVIATPEDGYYFNCWSSIWGFSSDSIYSFVVPFDMTVTAVFSEIPTVSIACSEDGMVAFQNSSETSMGILPGTDVTVIASPNAGFGFKGWFIVNDWYESLVSTDATYTFTVSEDISLVAKFYRLPEMVDLGLSVKWANYNVGATSPEEYGGYYAWGEIEEKGYYDFRTYKWCYGGSDFMAKYCVNSNNGTVDGKYVLELEDDVAYVAWGNDWRMPTTAEQRELYEKCTWEWTTLNGVNGSKVTGPNGNSIFLPVAGFKSYGTYINDNDFGCYWSSSVCSFYSNHAYNMNIGGAGISFFRDIRSTGLTVRPVSGPSIERVVIIEGKEGGSIDININGESSPTGLCAKGEMATVTATPKYGYEFIGWFVVDNPTPISTDTVYTFTVNDNVELIAEFEKLAVISINSKGNGSVSFENSTETTMIVKPNTPVTIVACPEEGFAFQGWYVDGKSVSTDANYTFIVSEDIALVAIFIDEDSLVDLGLPSGVKWATRNVGATFPEEYGDYFAWGETSVKPGYGPASSVTHNLSKSELESRGIIDADGNLTAAYDAATVNWGDNWRMPTSDEVNELISECTWNWTTQNGVHGYKVTGRNGNYIFLPAAGSYSGSMFYGADTDGYYWSATPYYYNNTHAFYLIFNSGRYYKNDNYRYGGKSVRPVAK